MSELNLVNNKDGYWNEERYYYIDKYGYMGITLVKYQEFVSQITLNKRYWV